MTASRGDFRNYNRMERNFSAQIEQQVSALKATLQAELAASEQRAKIIDAQLAATIAKLEAATAALEKRPQATDLGVLAIVVGSTLSVTRAGTSRMVVPFAGVRPTDILWARPDEYLPLDYGLPQVMCRNAGQMEVRIAVPAIALGTTKTINLAITALR
jgi:hypothetical protein